MWTDGNGFFYEGDCVPGDREATEEEVAEWTSARAARSRPADISDRQFSTGLWNEHLISFDEAHAFVSSGVIPTALQELIDQLPDDNTGAPTPRKLAQLIVSGATVYHRDNPLVDQIGAAFGWSAVTLDEKWRAWALL